MQLSSNLNNLKWASCLFVIISVAIIVFQPSLAKTTLIETTEACKKISGEELIYKEDETDITSVFRGTVKFNVKRIWLKGEVNGLLLESNGRAIIHCTEWMTMPEFVLVEEETEYTMFLLNEFRSTRFYIHSKVSCGNPCFYSRVDTVIIPSSFDYDIVSYVELQSKVYEYPSRWFRAYLNVEERWLLDNVNR